MLKSVLSQLVSKRVPVTLSKVSSTIDLLSDQQVKSNRRNMLYNYCFQENKSHLYQSVGFYFTTQQKLTIDDVIALEQEAKKAYQAQNFDECIDKFERSLKARKEIMGTENFPEVFAIYSNLGYLFQIKNRFEDAFEHYKKALEISYHVYEDKPRQIIDCLSLLGNLCSKIGKAKEALDYHHKALDLCLKNSTEKQREAICRNNLMAAYLDNSKADDALREGLLAKTIFEQLIQTNPKLLPLLRGTVLFIARAYLKTNQPDSAEKAYLEALNYMDPEKSESNDKAVPNDLPLILNEISSFYFMRDKFEKSIEYRHKALDAMKKMLGEEHSAIGEVYNNLAVTYYKKNDLDKAIEYAEKALSISRKTLGSNHKHTSNIIENLKRLYLQKNSMDKALKLTQEQYDALPEKDHQDPKKETELLNEIGCMLVRLNDNGFEEPLKKAVRLAESTSNYPLQTLFLLRENLAKGYEMQNNWQKALDIHNESAERILTTFGKDSNDYKIVQELIRNCKHQMGDHSACGENHEHLHHHDHDHSECDHDHSKCNHDHGDHHHHHHNHHHHHHKHPQEHFHQTITQDKTKPNK